MLKNFAIGLINIYQKISILKAKSCRYSPSCSEYAKEAIGKYGLLAGMMMGTKRILTCNPFFEGGYDPVK